MELVGICLHLHHGEGVGILFLVWEEERISASYVFLFLLFPRQGLISLLSPSPVQHHPQAQRGPQGPGLWGLSFRDTEST